VAIGADVDQSRERLLYEQALELARGLARDADFTVEEEGMVLTQAAARLLERLVAPLGGVWSSRQRREELIALALEALHLFRRDVDYRVQAGQVMFAPPPPGSDAPPGPDEEIKKLVEVKEGCRLSARREVLARLSLPRFFARYRDVAGVCADARSLESEFWSLYSLKTSLAGSRPPVKAAAVRMFATAEDKHAALVDAVRAASAEGCAVTVAVRRQAEAQAIQAALQAAGVEPGDAPAFALLPAHPAAAGAGGRRSRILVAELPDAARHVRRLQHETGADSCAVLLALDEEAVGARLGAALARLAQLALRRERELPPRLAAWFGGLAQRAAERAGRGARLELKARDRMLEDLLAFSGRQE
jgi:preprotein translocase subunit SecA